VKRYTHMKIMEVPSKNGSYMSVLEQFGSNGWELFSEQMNTNQMGHPTGTYDLLFRATYEDDEPKPIVRQRGRSWLYDFTVEGYNEQVKYDMNDFDNDQISLVRDPRNFNRPERDFLGRRRR
jgi:hypothetical protein